MMGDRFAMCVRVAGWPEGVVSNYRTSNDMGPSELSNYAVGCSVVVNEVMCELLWDTPVCN